MPHPHVPDLPDVPMSVDAALPWSNDPAVVTKQEALPNDAAATIAQALVARQAVLFVGAGVSMNVGLPSWRGLTAFMADELGLDPAHLRTPGLSDQTMAEFYRLKRGSLDEVSRWLKDQWEVCTEAVARSAIYELIVSLNFPVIYTTNYDRNLEIAYEAHGRPHLRITEIGDLAKLGGGVTPIIKIHGDLESPDTLVLTETDHFERLSFNAPLDIRFRADAMHKTLLFVGYSMSDMNIRLLFYRLWQTWQQSGSSGTRPPAFIFMPVYDPVQQAVLEHWGITCVTEALPEPGEALQAFLRKIKEHIQPSG
jgi:hypothetical protein